MISVPISVGELIDKVTILQIKLLEIKDKEKLKNVEKEYKELTALPIYKEFHDSMAKELNELFVVNYKLWNLEDDIRKCERENQFDESFISYARQIYKTNDERSRIKKKINLALNSDLIEEKSHEECI